MDESGHRSVDSDAALAAVARFVPDAVIVIDEDGCLLWANPAAERLFGFDTSAWIGRSGIELVHPADLDLVAGAMSTMRDKSVGTPLEVRLKTADGWRLVELIGGNAIDDPLIGGLVLSVRDLTERRRWEIAGDDSARFRAVIHNSPTMNFLLCHEGTIGALSGAVTRLLGHDPELLEGKPLTDLVFEPDRNLVTGAFEAAANEGVGSVARPVTTRVRMTNRDGVVALAAELAVVSLLDDPVLEGFIVSAQDVTALNEAKEALSALAHRDAVTGLPNRIALTEHLTTALADQTSAEPVVVVFLDLDAFKPVNDAYGHDAGDELLAAVAARFQAAVRRNDIVGRYAGDEFVVIARIAPAAVDHLVRRLQHAMDAPFELSSCTARVSVSAGVAIADPIDTVASLIGRADRQMYQVKRART